MNLNIIKTIQIKGSAPGVDQTTASVKKLGSAQTDVVKLSGELEKAARSMQAAQERQMRIMEQQARQHARFAQQMQQEEALRRADAAAIHAQAAANAELAKGLQAANDNAHSAGKSLLGTAAEAASMARHLGAATLAAYRFLPAFRAMVDPAIATGIRAIGPTAVSAGGTAMGALSPLLATVSRIALAGYLVVQAFRAMNAITELGAEKLKEFNEIAANAGKAGVGTDFFQRQAEGAKQLKLDTDAATGALTKFNEVSEPKLGGSAFQKRLDELVSFGNFAENANVAAVRNATSVEERYRAAVGLITTAIGQGERLAALDLAATFLPPAMLDTLRANGDALKELLATADKIKPADIVGVEQIGQAIDLKKRLEDANEVIEKRFAPIKKDLTQLGLNYNESWVATVELMAKAVTHAAALYDWLKGIPGILQKNAVQDWFQTFNDWSDKLGINATPESMGLTVGGIDPDMEAAQKRLAGLLKNQAAVQKAMRESTDISVAVFGDKSIAALEKVEKATSSGAGSYVLMIQRMKDRTAEMQQEINSNGKGAEAVARLKVQHDLVRSAMRDGIQIAKDGLPIDAAKRKEILDTADAYAKMATAQRLASIQNSIKLDRETMFLSDRDAQIARQLVPIYGTVEKALGSVEAADMRVNYQMQQSKTLASNFTQTLATGLLEGKNGFDVLISAAGQLGQAMLQIGAKDFASSMTAGFKGLKDGGGIEGFIGGFKGGGFDPASLAMTVAAVALGAFADGGKTKVRPPQPANDNKQVETPSDRDQYRSSAAA